MNILKNIKKNTIILLMITIVVLYIIIKNDFQEIVNTLKTINNWYILLAILFYLFYIGIKGYVNYLIVNDKKKISIKEAIKHNLIAQFFNGITPFSTGGEPMEVYMLTKHHISVEKATNYTIQSFIFYQIALVICGIVAIMYNAFFHIFPKVKLLSNLVLIGFLINVTVITVLLLISYSKFFSNIISKVIIKITAKMKIPEEIAQQKIQNYYEGFQTLKKRKALSIIGVGLNIIGLLCLYIIPLCILKSIGNGQMMSVIETLITSSYVYLIGAFVPVPGASGGIEYSFTQFYGNFVPVNNISAMVLLWRCITYYLGMIVGAIIFSIERKENE